MVALLSTLSVERSRSRNTSVDAARGASKRTRMGDVPNAMSSLTPKQIELLDWVRDRCPDDVYVGNAHRVSARALAMRGLLKIKGHGADWTVTLTDAGRYWKPGRAVPRPAPIRLPKRSALAPAPIRDPDPEQPGKMEQANELMRQVIAAGGHLPLPDRLGVGEVTRELIRLSIWSPDRPHGKQLEVVSLEPRPFGPQEITFTDYFPDLVARQPVPVPDHVGKYSPTVRAYLDAKDWQYVSAAHLARAARILEAIAREATNRGLKVSTSAGAKSHVTLGVGDRSYEVQIRETSAPGGAEVPYGMRRKGPRWTYDRQRAFVSTGKLELIVRGRYANYDGDRYRDTKMTTLESKLPRLFQSLEVYRLQAEVAAAVQRRREEERQRQWEAAMAEARVRYDHHVRWEHFKETSKEWQQVREHREFLAVARAAAAAYEGDDKEAVLAQLDMAERQLDELDPVRRLSLLVPDVKEPKNDDLKPFLKGWSPQGPNGY